MKEDRFVQIIVAIIMIAVFLLGAKLDRQYTESTKRDAAIIEFLASIMESQKVILDNQTRIAKLIGE